MAPQPEGSVLPRTESASSVSWPGFPLWTMLTKSCDCAHGELNSTAATASQALARRRTSAARRLSLGRWSGGAQRTTDGSDWGLVMSPAWRPAPGMPPAADAAAAPAPADCSHWDTCALRPVTRRSSRTSSATGLPAASCSRRSARETTRRRRVSASVGLCMTVTPMSMSACSPPRMARSSAESAGPRDLRMLASSCCARG
mmetsp:Transcript_11854/g.46299  ORF Transcript_11854/g.46299 Transcript_11854/m.46299 type:complete len:201 (+) Transcript_11854:592-1194(+)